MMPASLHSHFLVVQACQLFKQQFVGNAKHSDSSDVICCLTSLQDED